MPKKNAKAHFLRRDLPRLDLLRTFESAARTLSFTLAADELALTQSAVSRQIQQMEADLGVRLFERRHRALELTEAGLVLQRAVIDALERLRDATARLRAPTVTRHVAITSTPGFASLWLIPRLASFTDLHPDVDVRVSATTDMLDLVRQRIDIAVRFVPLESGKGEPLFEEVVEPMCAPALVSHPDHPLLAPQDLRYQTLLTIEAPRSTDFSADWEPWAQILGLPGLKMKNSLRFSSYSDAVAAAVAGQGVVIGRLPLLDALLRDGRLVAPFGIDAGVASRRAYFVELAPQAERNPDALAFVRWLRAQAADAVSGETPSAALPPVKDAEAADAFRAPARTRSPAPRRRTQTPRGTPPAV